MSILHFQTGQLVKKAILENTWSSVQQRPVCSLVSLIIFHNFFFIGLIQTFCFCFKPTYTYPHHEGVQQLFQHSFWSLHFISRFNMLLKVFENQTLLSMIFNMQLIVPCWTSSSSRKKIAAQKISVLVIYLPTHHDMKAYGMLSYTNLICIHLLKICFLQIQNEILKKSCGLFTEDRNVYLFWVHVSWAVILHPCCHFQPQILRCQLQHLFRALGDLKVQIEPSPLVPQLVLVEVTVFHLLLPTPPEEKQKLT